MRTGRAPRGGTPGPLRPPRALASFEEVLRRELDLIAARRKAAGAKEGVSGAEDALERAQDMKLVGLCLSGGGIRSASFNLGLLQALGRCGVLRATDYLSTVSGGGYIGSCLSSLCSSPSADLSPDAFPFAYNGQTERAEIKHLRERGEYLAPRHGLLSGDTWRLVSTYVGGLVITVVTIYALIAAAGALGFLVFPWIVRFLYPTLEPLLSALLGGPIAAAGIVLPPIETALVSPFDYAVTLLSPAIVFAILWALFSLGYVVATAVPRVWTIGYRRSLTTMQGWCLFAAVALAVFGSLPLLFKASDQILGTLRAVVGALGLQTLLGALSPLVFGDPQKSRWPGLRRRVVPAAAGLLVALVCLFTLYVVWKYQAHAGTIIGGAAVIVVLLSITTDINRVSMFFFYRDRLSEAFLFRRKPNTANAEPAASRDVLTDMGDLEATDALRLSDLSDTDRRIPYHLVNAAVNCPGSRSLALRGRKADFFLLSPLYCGSSVTQYAPTHEFERNRVTLGTAMAISGAAANPQHGHSSQPALAFLMTLLNVRLGLWAENPRFTLDLIHRFTTLRFLWPLALCLELLSRTNESHRLVNVSDGGHIENLGMYELLKRRCRIIVASDAGADPQRQFGDLGSLMRLARIDLGVHITIDPRPLQPDTTTGLSTAHLVTGTIAYPTPGAPPEVGTLYYIKTALTQGDPRDLHEYRARHDEYPHETTADQFFDEEQFESYRELGYQSGRALRDLLRLQKAEDGGSLVAAARPAVA